MIESYWFEVKAGYTPTNSITGIIGRIIEWELYWLNNEWHKNQITVDGSWYEINK